MEGRNGGPRTYLNLLGIILLVLGLACATFVYRAASGLETGPGDAIGYEQGGEGAYRVSPEDSKSYERSMELYGGKANLLADELRRWLAGLWHGKSLAFTIGFITIAASLAVFGLANYVVPLTQNDGEDEERTDVH